MSFGGALYLILLGEVTRPGEGEELEALGAPESFCYWPCSRAKKNERERWKLGIYQRAAGGAMGKGLEEPRRMHIPSPKSPKDEEASRSGHNTWPCSTPGSHWDPEPSRGAAAAQLKGQHLCKCSQTEEYSLQLPRDLPISWASCNSPPATKVISKINPNPPPSSLGPRSPTARSWHTAAVSRAGNPLETQRPKLGGGI